MLNTKKILSLLSKQEKIRAIYLLILILIMALIDMIGIASIMPFIALLTNPETINTNGLLNFVYKKSNIFGIDSEQDFLILTGFIVFFLLIISISVKALTTYFQSRYVRYCEYSLSKRLTERYIYQPYSWFLNRNSSILGKTILSETGNVISRGLSPTLSLITNILVALALFVLLVYVNPTLTLIVALTVSLFYVAVSIILRKLLNKSLKKIFLINSY